MINICYKNFKTSKNQKFRRMERLVVSQHETEDQDKKNIPDLQKQRKALLGGGKVPAMHCDIKAKV
jgi:hypothetical protein